MRVAMVVVGLLTVLSIGIATSFAQEWHIEVVDSEGIVGKYTSIVLDSQEYAHISYYDVVGRDLKYARWTGSEWDIQSVDCDENVGEYTSLALDSVDRPHISYYDHTNGDLKYARWTGSEWDILTVDFGGNVGAFSSIVLDDQEYPHVSYIDWSSHDLKYASWTGNEWGIETVDFEGRLAGNTSLALDSEGNPHISYLRDDTALHEPKYAYWTGSEWDVQVVESGCDVRNDTSLALDSLDRPHISYFESMEHELRYAKWTGSEWDIQTVDSGACMNDYCSIALDSSDYPHIAYMRFYTDPWDADLKYARWTGGEWEIQLVDYEGFVGMYASLALDNQNHPHISYLEYVDASNGHLKYARYANGQSVGLLELSAKPMDDGILVDWLFPGQMPVGIQVLRSVGSSEPIALHGGPLSGWATFYTDRDVDAGVGYRYWLEVTGAGGSIHRLGPTKTVVVPEWIVEVGVSETYPSPARDTITIGYSLLNSSSVELSIYDVSGRRLATLVSGEQTAGEYRVSWDCTHVPSGIYLYHLDANGEGLSRRFVVSR